MNTAKLTKAAFSNEIFSDLSDYEISTVPGVSDVSDEEEVEGEFETSEDHPPKHRAKSRVEPDSDEHPAELVRRKRRASMWTPMTKSTKSTNHRAVRIAHSKSKRNRPTTLNP